VLLTAVRGSARPETVERLTVFLSQKGWDYERLASGELSEFTVTKDDLAIQERGLLQRLLTRIRGEPAEAAVTVTSKKQWSSSTLPAPSVAAPRQRPKAAWIEPQLRSELEEAEARATLAEEKLRRIKSRVAALEADLALARRREQARSSDLADETQRLELRCAEIEDAFLEAESVAAHFEQEHEASERAASNAESELRSLWADQSNGLGQLRRREESAISALEAQQAQAQRLTDLVQHLEAEAQDLRGAVQTREHELKVVAQSEENDAKMRQMFGRCLHNLQSTHEELSAQIRAVEQSGQSEEAMAANRVEQLEAQVEAQIETRDARIRSLVQELSEVRGRSPATVPGSPAQALPRLSRSERIAALQEELAAAGRWRPEEREGTPRSERAAQRKSEEGVQPGSMQGWTSDIGSTEALPVLELPSRDSVGSIGEREKVELRNCQSDLSECRAQLAREAELRVALQSEHDQLRVQIDQLQAIRQQDIDEAISALAAKNRQLEEELQSIRDPAQGPAPEETSRWPAQAATAGQTPVVIDRSVSGSSPPPAQDFEGPRPVAPVALLPLPGDPDLRSLAEQLNEAFVDLQQHSSSTPAIEIRRLCAQLLLSAAGDRQRLRSAQQELEQAHADALTFDAQQRLVQRLTSEVEGLRGELKAANEKAVSPIRLADSMAAVPQVAGGEETRAAAVVPVASSPPMRSVAPSLRSFSPPPQTATRMLSSPSQTVSRGFSPPSRPARAAATPLRASLGASVRTILQSPVVRSRSSEPPRGPTVSRTLSQPRLLTVGAAQSPAVVSWSLLPNVEPQPVLRPECFTRPPPTRQIWAVPPPATHQAPAKPVSRASSGRLC